MLEREQENSSYKESEGFCELIHTFFLRVDSYHLQFNNGAMAKYLYQERYLGSVKKMIDEKTIFEAAKIKDFINEYTAKETIRQYKIALKKYFIHYNKDPDSYIKDIRNMDNGNKNKVIDQYEKDISHYRNYLIESDYSPKAIHNYISAIKMFLEHHRIDLDKAFWKKLKQRGIEKVAEPICNFKIPTSSDLKQILTHASTKPRAMFLLQSSSGMRIGEICSLKLSDIDLEYEYPHITLRKTKSRAKGRTRCSPEAKEAITEWLKIRKEQLELKQKRTLDKYQNPEDKDKLFPGTPKSARKMWNNLLRKSNFAKKDKTGKYERNLMSTHTLRKFFRNEVSKYDNQLAAYLMNQRTALDRKYRDWNDDYLDQEYAKGVQYLMVFQSNVTDERINDLDIQLKDVTIDNAKLKQEIFELRQMISELGNQKLEQAKELSKK